MLFKAHVIKLKPNKTQERLLTQSCGVARFSYNWALGQWNQLYKSGEIASVNKLQKKLDSIKRDQFPWMLDISKHAPQNAIINLGQAFKGFFEKRTRHPKFKKRVTKKPSLYGAIPLRVRM